MLTSRRLRRRGPRSLHAVDRRCRLDTQNSGLHRPRGSSLCKSKLALPSNDCFTLVHLNMHGFCSHRHELEVQLEVLGYPDFVAITETVLDKSTISPALYGYELISRLDRRDGRSGGGIAFFARSALAKTVVHMGDSANHERSWHTLHSDRGPILLGVWYRPPAYGETASISHLASEIQCFGKGALANIIVGDMNVHHRAWLQYSSSITPEGKSLFETCCRLGLSECVQRPTRGLHLLDLVLTDLPTDCSIEVRPGVSDHCLVLCRLSMGIPEEKISERNCFEFKHANWRGLNQCLQEIDWKERFAHCSVDTTVATFTSTILDSAKNFIPYHAKSIAKNAHPWINARCRQLVAAKNQAMGNPDFESKRDLCSIGLRHEFAKYIASTKERIRKLHNSSKQWWHFSKSLLLMGGNTSSIPAMKNGSGQWIKDPKEKAELFAKTFRDKSALPPPRGNEYNDVADNVSRQMSGFLPIRQRHVQRILQNLREDSATGPDELPARILKRCAKVLALPITMLARQLLQSGVWPKGWKLHWVFPLHKKKSRADAGNYRGIHLTTQLSKALERVLALLFRPFLEATHAYGPNQFAYCSGRGVQDALAYNILRWLLAFHAHRTVALYCSDVSGAFDRVPAQRLVRKLRAKGLHPELVRLLSSWLSTRHARIVVDGQMSDECVLEDSVFQGTVLGPMLWNCFYEDARRAVNTLEFMETVFADDFNAYRTYHSTVPSAQIQEDLEECQASLHQWGAGNQVIFDASKESFHQLHPQNPVGTPFKFLGVTFDLKLNMDTACCELAAESHFRLQGLLRCQRFYDVSAMLTLYRAQVLSYIEFRTPAIYHAPKFFLRMVDRVQDTFLEEMNIDPAKALLTYHLAPLQTRRDIAMLGLLYRIANDLAPQQFKDLIKPAGSVAYPRGWAHTMTRHEQQMFDPIDGSHTRALERSVLGLIYVWNLLPHHVVARKTVRSFQRCLQEAVKRAAQRGIQDWANFLRVGPHKFGPTLFRSLFFRA